MGVLSKSIAAGLSMTSGLSQNISVSDVCSETYPPGQDVVSYTLPYTYDQVKPFFGSFANVSYFGVSSATLNGSDNAVGTSRTYTLQGATVVDTIGFFDDPPAPGPWLEYHNTALATFPSYNTSLYLPYDATFFSSVCDGMATKITFYTQYCATNPSAAGELLHSVHLNGAITIGKMLGGRNFTSCAALEASNTTTWGNSTTSSNMTTSANTTSSGAASTSVPVSPAKYTGAATTSQISTTLASLAIVAILAWL